MKKSIIFLMIGIFTAMLGAVSLPALAADNYVDYDSAENMAYQSNGEALPITEKQVISVAVDSTAYTVTGGGQAAELHTAEAVQAVAMKLTDNCCLPLEVGWRS